MDSPFIDSSPQNPSPFTDMGSQMDTSPFIDSTPQDISKAEGHLDNHDWDGLCETFVSQMTDGKNWGPTAFRAFQNQLIQGKAVADPTLNGATPGSKIYFAADGSNGENGHVGIMINPTSFISADYDGVKVNNLSRWEKSTGQRPIGYVPQ